MHRCRVFGSLAFLRLLSVAIDTIIYARPRNNLANSYLTDQLIAGYWNNDSLGGNDGIDSRDDIGSEIEIAFYARYRRGYSIHCE